MKYMNITYRPNLKPMTREERDRIMADFMVERLEGKLDVHARLGEALRTIRDCLSQGELMDNQFNVVYKQDRSIYMYLTTFPSMETYDPILDVITYLEFKNPAFGYEEDFLKRVHTFDKEVYANTARHQSGTGLLKRRLAELKPLIINFLHELQTYIRYLEEELNRFIDPHVLPNPKVDVTAIFSRA